MGAGLQELQAVTVPLAAISSVGLLEQSATKKLQTAFGDIVRSVLAEIDDLSLRAAKAPSVSVFKEERAEKLYPVFVRLTRATSELLEAKLDRADIAVMTDFSFTVIQTEVETEWGSFFSPETYNDIVFALSALKSSQALVRRVMAVQLPDDPDLKRQNYELRKGYNLAAPWAHFHFEILRAAFVNKVTIAPDVLQEILAGLRAAVMAYSYIRQAAELRSILNDRYSEEFEIVWDEEDKELANSE